MPIVRSSNMDGLPAPRLRRRCACDGLPAQGTVLSNSNGSIQTRRFVGEPGWSDFERTNASVGYALDQELGDIFSFHQNLRYSFSSYDRNPVQNRDFSDATFGPNYGADGAALSPGVASSPSLDDRT